MGKVIDMTKRKQPPKRRKEGKDMNTEPAPGRTAHARLSSDKPTALPYRLTRAKRQQLETLADILSEGKEGRHRATLTDTLDRALDALDEKLRGSKTQQ